MLRPYRRKLKEGQTSPLDVVVDYVCFCIEHIRGIKGLPLSVLDVGCGSGELMRAVKARLGPDIIEYAVGIDYSSSTIKLLQDKGIYDQLFCATATSLPVHTLEFDITISIECIEHLYREQVPSGLNEILRSAHYIVITTPTPRAVINEHWLSIELQQARADKDPIDFEEFCILEGAVHKSIVRPESMIEAGFIRGDQPDAQFYFGESQKIINASLAYAGIAQREMPANLYNHDFRPNYVQLLEDSLALGDYIGDNLLINNQDNIH